MGVAATTALQLHQGSGKTSAIGDTNHEDDTEDDKDGDVTSREQEDLSNR